ncbi:hypothetical protein Bbelb_364480 [Branchiostoma belcheri]|nr:hypothetical protein Bbelb_364480 [Branchiostoma belcheri]
MPRRGKHGTLTQANFDSPPGSDQLAPHCLVVAEPRLVLAALRRPEAALRRPVVVRRRPEAVQRQPVAARGLAVPVGAGGAGGHEAHAVAEPSLSVLPPHVLRECLERAEETITTSSRFAALEYPDNVQLASSEECDACSPEQDDQIDLYRKQQQQRFYQSKAHGKTVIIGDSMIKDLKPNKMSKNRSVKCFTHRGARIEQLLSPARRIVSAEDPHTVIIRAGTNNSKDSVQVVIDKAHDFTTTLRETGVRNIAVSGVISRADTDPERTHLINLGLAGMCTSNGMTFIDNSNIGPRYICQDGVHLNRHGTVQLATNLITSRSDAIRHQSWRGHFCPTPCLGPRLA